MRLKEINPGMVIHCKNDEEKKALLEEAERLGYLWKDKSCPTDFQAFKQTGMTIHFYDSGLIAWSDKKKGSTEFSDLIMPELTAEEAFQWISEHYRDEEWIKCFGKNYCMDDLIRHYGAEIVVSMIANWQADNEKKDPEIETVDICRIIEIQPDGRKRCVHEEDIKSELPFGGDERQIVQNILKRYLAEHDGEFIAVHEVVSRVKAVE